MAVEIYTIFSGRHRFCRNHIIASRKQPELLFSRCRIVHDTNPCDVPSNMNMHTCVCVRQMCAIEVEQAVLKVSTTRVVHDINMLITHTYTCSMITESNLHAIRVFACSPFVFLVCVSSVIEACGIK